MAPVGAGRHTDQFGEATAEGAQRRAADRETDLGDAEVATTQQRHRALDAPRHQVAVRRLAVGEPGLAAEGPRRHVRAAGERGAVSRRCCAAAGLLVAREIVSRRAYSTLLYTPRYRSVGRVETDERELVSRCP